MVSLPISAVASVIFAARWRLHPFLSEAASSVYLERRSSTFGVVLSSSSCRLMVGGFQRHRRLPAASPEVAVNARSGCVDAPGSSFRRLLPNVASGLCGQDHCMLPCCLVPQKFHHSPHLCCPRRGRNDRKADIGNEGSLACMLGVSEHAHESGVVVLRRFNALAGSAGMRPPGGARESSRRSSPKASLPKVR